MYLFGVTYEKPSRKEAARRDTICKEEGGEEYIEINTQENNNPGINNGKYQGWFTALNRGEPFDSELASRVLQKVYNQKE